MTKSFTIHCIIFSFKKKNIFFIYGQKLVIYPILFGQNALSRSTSPCTKFQLEWMTGSGFTSRPKIWSHTNTIEVNIEHLKIMKSQWKSKIYDHLITFTQYTQPQLIYLW